MPRIALDPWGPNGHFYFSLASQVVLIKTPRSIVLRKTTMGENILGNILGHLLCARIILDAGDTTVNKLDKKRLFKELSFENREKTNRHININTIETTQKSENSSLRKKVLFWQRSK